MRFLIVLAILWIAPMSPAGAFTILIENPSAWRLQNYAGDVLYVFFTSSPCSQGSFILSTGMTANDKDRFWSTVMTAKVTNRTVGLTYDVVGADCVVSTFFLP